MYTCPDRNKLETYIIAAQQTTPLFPVKQLEVESSENWDDVYIFFQISVYLTYH